MKQQDESIESYSGTAVEGATTPLSCSLDELQAAYRASFEAELGDAPGRLAAYDYLASSTAIYHGEVIGLGFIPQIYGMSALRHFDDLTQTTYHILEKVTQRFLDDPGYRRLFEFSPTLERLICLPTGYTTTIPIMRIDLFLDEPTGDFRFCEFNTDGTSAMNEDREGANALARSASYARAAEELGLEPQELFEGWVDAFCAIYESSAYAVSRAGVPASGDRAYSASVLNQPTIAIVDYLASATLYEFEEFRSRFEARGYHCLICDLPGLTYRDGALWGEDIDPTRQQAGDAERIDAVYRRAVTGEILSELEVGAATDATDALTDATVDVADAADALTNATIDAADAVDAAITGTTAGAMPPPIRGAHALVRAVEEGTVCMIGGFVTHIAHCKQLFTVLHLPQTAAFLTPEEKAFIKRHVPYTTRLEQGCIDLEQVIADKDAWIIKPEDGYASKGVYAGVDYSATEWRALIDECSREPYVVQSYCPQYATPNVRLGSPDTSQTLEPFNILTGLYLYNGRFSGIFVRAGQKGIIVGYAGGITVPALLAGYDPAAGLALRARKPE